MKILPTSEGLALTDRIPVTARTVLEVATHPTAWGHAWLRRAPQATWNRRVLPPDALSTLRTAVEQAPADVLVLDGVLAPDLLAALRPPLAPHALCVARVLNPVHWSRLAQMLGGQRSAAAVDGGLGAVQSGLALPLPEVEHRFASAGWTVLDATPVIEQPGATRHRVEALAPMASALGIDPAVMRDALATHHWIVRAAPTPQPEPLSIAALGLRKMAGVTEPRVDHPLTALNSLPAVRAVWSSSQLQLPADWAPGILVLHRQFMNHEPFNASIERLIAKGWTVVADMDDDPHHWKAYIDSDFRAFRGVHAVTVSTPALAEMIRTWNPHVTVFPNAILDLPQRPARHASGWKTAVPRLFFGALNRRNDWGPVMEGISAAAAELGSQAEWVVVHDRDFYDQLPESVPKTFHPTLPAADYLPLLATCDLNLMPLADTPFNRLKSDLKFIESCAAGAVPLCSRVVYADRPEHETIGVFPQGVTGWRDALLQFIRSPEDAARRAELGLDYVCRHRTHAQQAPLRLAHAQAVLAQRAELESQRQARLKR